MKYNENGTIDYEEFNNPLEKPEPIREDYSDKADDVNGCWQDCKEFCGREFDVDGEEINQEYEQHLEDTDIRQ